MSWKKLALSLPFGSSRKIRCCGDGPSTYVSNDPKGIRIGPCFRCGDRDFEAHSGITAKQLAEWRKADDSFRGLREMPSLVPPDRWPVEYLVWLGQAGIGVNDAVRYGSGYSERHSRFMLRCAIDGKPTGAFTGRSLDNKRPKYVAGGTGEAIWIGGSGEAAVFVEDMLSAWRVSAAGYRAVAVLGTSFPASVLRVATANVSECVGWFDPDPAGQKAYRTLRKTLGLYDVTVRKVSSERDPKLHSKKEIQQLIGEYDGK